MYRLVNFALFLITVLAVNAAQASSDELKIESVRGSPKIYTLNSSTPSHEKTIKAGDTYPLPVDIETGAEEAITLLVHGSRVEVLPNTTMHIKRPQGSTQSVLQKTGAAVFKVSKQKKGRNFEVETPYLTSVVKGTLFSIVLSDDRAVVSLLEGALLVRTLDGIERFMMPGDVIGADESGSTTAVLAGDDSIVEESQQNDTPDNFDDALAIDEGEADEQGTPESLMQEAADDIREFATPIPSEEIVDDPIEDTIEEPTDDPVDNPMDDSMDDPVDTPEDEAVDDSMDDPVEDPVIDEPGDDAMDDPIDDAIDDMDSDEDDFDEDEDEDEDDDDDEDEDEDDDEDEDNDED